LPGFSDSAIVHVVAPLVVTQPDEPGVKFAARFTAAVQALHPLPGFTEPEIDCVDDET
jgi:hypothetical protein